MRFLIAIVLASTCFNTFANTTICTTCSTFEQFDSAAQSAPADGTLNIYVVNPLTKQVKRFRRGTIGTEYPVSSAVTNYVNFVIENNRREIHIDNRAEFPQNAYDLVERPQSATAVGNYLKNSGIGFLNDFIQLLTVVNTIPGFNPDKISLTIKVILADGSTALFVYNNTTKTWERVESQTIDSSNNVVPETRADAVTPGRTITYRFPNSDGGDRDLINFIQRLNMLGIPISGKVGKNGTVTIDCSGDNCIVQTPTGG